MESSGTYIPINASGVADREVVVRGMSVKDGLSMDVVKESRRLMVGGEFAVSQPDLEILVGKRVEHRG